MRSTFLPDGVGQDVWVFSEGRDEVKPIMHVKLNIEQKYYKINNKMGNSTPEFCSSNKIDVSNLSIIKNSSLGTHYKQKQSNKQLLYIQTRPQQNDSYSYQKTIISKHLTQRIDTKNKNIPQIVSIKKTLNNFCSMGPSIELWMVHPSRSLKQQILQRQYTNQAFQQGQIWMIIYSALNALISYEHLAQNIILSLQNIFISEAGDVIVSDAKLFRQQFYPKSQRTKQINQNIDQLSQIINRIVMLGNKVKYVYSQKLDDFREVLVCKQNRFVSYHKLINFVINQKIQKQKQQIIASSNNTKKQLIQQVQSRIVYIQQFSEPSKQYGKQQKVQSSNNIDVIANKSKKKFYRTAPILRSIQLPVYKSNILQTQNISNNYDKIWTQSSNFSSINSLTETTQNQLSKISYKDNTINIVNRLFGQQNSNKKQQLQNKMESQAKNLFFQNKQFLQTLIQKQKNMILQVTESQVDLQSHRSMRSPSGRNFQVLSSSILNSTRHQQSQQIF